ncbi:MAG: hypothetical protein ACI92Z_000435 [Paracoccaceae bacterium]|jgi:hypothetical protein
MTMITRLFCTTALSAFTFASVASAQVTANDVWQNTRDAIATLGGDFSAAKARRGDTLSITDMRLAFQLPFDAGSLSLTLPDFQLSENGDGTVSLTYPKTSTYNIAVVITDEGSFSGNLNLTYDTFSYIASGNPRDVTYTYSIGKMTMDTSDIAIEGDNLPDEPIAVSMQGTVLGLSGTTRIRVGSLVAIKSDVTIKDQDFLVKADLPEASGIEYSTTLKNQSTMAEITLPRNGMDILNLAAAFRSGLRVVGTSTIGLYETRQIDKANGEIVSDQITTVNAYNTKVEVNQSHLKVSGTTSEATITIGKNPIVPFPIFLSVKSTESAVELPFLASSKLQDFGLSMLLNDLVVPDSIMAMMDPTHALPNVPATISIDLSGKVKNMIDWLDIETVLALDASQEMPVEMHALTLNTLLLDMLGAQLNGSGAATFDNTDGTPRPIGTLDLSLIGGNTLLDTLVSVGLVSEEQAMGARLAIATVTRPDPDAGEDALKSKLEINDQGHITANGMRIK